MSAFDRELLSQLPALRRYANKLTRNSQASEDLVQDVLVRALHYKESFVMGTSMLAWLVTICRNRWYSVGRTSWRLIAVDSEQLEAVPFNSHTEIRLEVHDTLAALNNLTPEQKFAVWGKAMDVPIENLAIQAGVPLGTIKSRISRGRQALQKALGE